MASKFTAQSLLPVAKDTGKLLLRYYGQMLTAKLKSDQSPLTEADLAANEMIREGLAAIDSSIPFLSEESPLPPFEERKHWKHFWLVDPLDGTKEFLKHNGEFTINIAYVKEGIPVVGLIYAPAMESIYFAEKGKGTWKQEGNGPAERIYTRFEASREPLVALESRSHPSPELDYFLEKQAVDRRIQLGSAMKFAYLAEGKANLYARFNPCMEWDVAAGDCLVRYAARSGENTLPFRYNKENLTVPPFVIGRTRSENN